MLGSKLEKVDKQDITEYKLIFSAYTKRLLKPLIVFEFITIILNIIKYTLNGQGILEIVLRIIQSVIFYPRGSLWYIQACIVGIWLIYWFKKKKYKSFSFAVFAYLFALINNSYFFVIENTIFGRVMEIFLKITVSTRNGIFYGFSFILLGIWTYGIHCKLSQYKYARILLGVLMIFLYILYLFEIHFLHGKTYKDDGSLFIILPFFIVVFVLWAATYITTNKNSIIFRNLSTGIYLLHSPILAIVTIIESIFEINQNIIIKFVIVFIVSHCICLISYYKGNRFSTLLK